MNEAALAELVGERGAAVGRTAVVGNRPLRLGRLADNDLVLADEGVSRHHAIVEPQGDALVVRDLGSRNGTWVNGQRIVGPQVLRVGDRLEIGTSAFGVRWPEVRSPLLQPDRDDPLDTAEVSTPQPGRPVPLIWPLAVGALGFLLLVVILQSCF